MPAAGAIIGAVGSVAGGAMGARGEAQAAAATAQGQRDAIQAQLAMYNQSRADMLPMIQARNAALPLFMQLLGLQMPSVTSPSAGGVQMNVTGARPSESLSGALRDAHWLGGSNVQSHREMFWNPFEALQHTRDTVGRDRDIWFGDATHPDIGDASFTYDEDGNVIGSQPSTTQTAAPIDLNALIAATPGYQFRFNEGQRAAERSAAARGSLASGGTLRALTRYGEGLAANEFGDFANRLASLIGLGQTAATTAGGWGNQVGGNIGQNLSNIGQARGSGYANTANIWGNAIGSAANQFGQYWNRPQTTTVPDSFTTNYSPTPYQGTFGTYGGGGP